MKILLTSPEQKSLTGQPMYVRNLAKGLTELGHEVTCSEEPSGDYDIAVINDYYPECLGKFTAKKIFNLCHSMNPPDKPIEDDRITGYIAPREQVAEVWDKEFKILPIPIDFKRWQIPKIKHDKYTIIAPCTIDTLRESMLDDLCDRANKDCEVWIVGRNHGMELRLNEYVKVFHEREDIENLMCRCDELAGIYIGTVTLEAWAMGLKTSVYDEYGTWKYVEKPNDFDKHNYIKVAKKLLTF